MSGAVETKETRSEDVLHSGRRKSDAKQWKVMAEMSESAVKISSPSTSHGTIRRRVLATTNAYEYDNVTARKQALAKYTSDSCAPRGLPVLALAC